METSLRPQHLHARMQKHRRATRSLATPASVTPSSGPAASPSHGRISHGGRVCAACAHTYIHTRLRVNVCGATSPNAIAVVAWVGGTGGCMASSVPPRPRCLSFWCSSYSTWAVRIMVRLAGNLAPAFLPRPLAFRYGTSGPYPLSKKLHVLVVAGVPLPWSCTTGSRSKLAGVVFNRHERLHACMCEAYVASVKKKYGVKASSTSTR